MQYLDKQKCFQTGAMHAQCGVGVGKTYNKLANGKAMGPDDLPSCGMLQKLGACENIWRSVAEGGRAPFNRPEMTQSPNKQNTSGAQEEAAHAWAVAISTPGGRCKQSAEQRCHVLPPRIFYLLISIVDRYST